MKIAEFPRKSLFAIVLCLLSVCPAARMQFTIDVDGGQASAGRGTGSLARGAGTVTLDTSSNRLEWEVEFETGALMDGALSVTDAHFHAGAIGSHLPVSTAGTRGSDQFPDDLQWQVCSRRGADCRQGQGDL